MHVDWHSKPEWSGVAPIYTIVGYQRDQSASFMNETSYFSMYDDDHAYTYTSLARCTDMCVCVQRCRKTSHMCAIVRSVVLDRVAVCDQRTIQYTLTAAVQVCAMVMDVLCACMGNMCSAAWTIWRRACVLYSVYAVYAVLCTFILILKLIWKCCSDHPRHLGGTVDSASNAWNIVSRKTIPQNSTILFIFYIYLNITFHRIQKLFICNKLYLSIE